MNNENLPMMLSANDLQAMGLTRTMVYSLFKREDFPTVKIGNRLFVQRDKLFAWLEKQEVVKMQ